MLRWFTPMMWLKIHEPDELWLKLRRIFIMVEIPLTDKVIDSGFKPTYLDSG